MFYRAVVLQKFLMCSQFHSKCRFVPYLWQSHCSPFFRLLHRSPTSDRGYFYRYPFSFMFQKITVPPYHFLNSGWGSGHCYQKAVISARSTSGPASKTRWPLPDRDTYVPILKIFFAAINRQGYEEWLYVIFSTGELPPCTLGSVVARRSHFGRLIVHDRRLMVLT